MNGTAHPAVPPPGQTRLVALDWLRGLVMVVMAVDHVDAVFDPRHASGDSAGFHQPAPLPPAEFLTRWATHLCAPTFVFLAGTGLALSIGRMRERDVAWWRIDGHLLLRGFVLLALEATLILAGWRWMEHDDFRLPGLLLQVIWAIGAGFVLLVGLRRLPAGVLLLLAATLPVVTELVWRQYPNPMSCPLAVRLAFLPGIWPAPRPQLYSLYPLLPWLAPMLAGWWFGTRLRAGADLGRLSAASACVALTGFAVLRGLDGFGNMGLHRRSGDVLEWLHCSKYPPSATFLLLELGLMALLLAVLARRPRPDRGEREGHPLVILGQVPLFFYLLHPWVIGAWWRLGVLDRPQPWWTSWLLAAATALVLLPFCALYRWYKQRWRHAWTRLL